MLAKSLAHSWYSHTECGTLLVPGSDSVGKAAPTVFDLQNEFSLIFLQPDNRGLAARVTYDVCQSFLNHTKEVGFQLRRQSANVLSDLQAGLDAGPFFEPFDIPTQSADQS